MAKRVDPRRKQLKARVKEITQHMPTIDDPFGGLGDWDPSDAPKMAIARAIGLLEGMKLTRPKPVAQKPKTVKRAPKPKPQPKPKKGKKVGKVNEVCLKSPFTRETQWMPLVAELSELLAEGWEVVDADNGVEAAFEFLTTGKELQRA